MGSPNRFNTFRDLVATNALAPATTNLFQIMIPAPPIFGQGGNGAVSGARIKRVYETINYYASSVTTPSRALTTSEINNFGMMRRFATGQTNSEVTISFLVTKDQMHRDFFEAWLHSAASDSDNSVAFYDDYTVDLQIVKWEHGANFKLTQRDERTGKNKKGMHPMQATGVWKLFGAFPTNISTQTFDNEATGLLQMDIQFYFERYRFDQVSPKTLKTKGGRAQTFTFSEVRTKVEGSGNPDVQRFSIG